MYTLISNLVLPSASFTYPSLYDPIKIVLLFIEGQKIKTLGLALEIVSISTVVLSSVNRLFDFARYDPEPS